MTLKELMIGSMQSSQGTSVFQTGGQTNSIKAGKDRNYSSFDLILSKKLNNADKQTILKTNKYEAAVSRNELDTESVRTNSKSRYLTFQEANENNRKSATENNSVQEKLQESNKDNKSEDINKEEQKDALRNVPANMLQLFAQAMGLDIRELQNLLKEAGITSEGFNSQKNISDTAADLSQLLALSDEQKAALEKLLQMMGDTLNSQLSTLKKESQTFPADASTEEGVSQKAEPDAIRTTVEASDSRSISDTVLDSGLVDEKLSMQIKRKLDEVGKQLEAGQGSLEKELKELILPLQEKTVGKTQIPLKQDAQVMSTELAEQAPSTVGTMNEQEMGNAAEDNEGQEMDSEQTEVMKQPVTIAKEVQPQPVFSVVQPDNTNAAAVIEKTVAAPVQNREIINQIIENAKVVISADKSEMVMDLKPDSLGRISLKVVTENGIVMAKFVAESQQVRQVLESNMQLLKDSLEKQGMNVQGFSVSVRQDSSRSDTNKSQYEKTGTGNTGRTLQRITGLEGQMAGFLEPTGRTSPYQWESSTINLTA